MPASRRAALITAALWPLAPVRVRAQAGSATAEPDSPMWPRIVASVFGGRTIVLATPAQLQLQAPARAVDAAFVPITVRSGVTVLRRLTLVVDNNPAPVAAVLVLGADGSPADIETRLRVDDYSMVRAVAELADGQLVMAARHVKAAGGCSAPPGADAAAAAAALGRQQLRVDPAAGPGQPRQAQWQISHPNHSGLAMDQLSRLYTPSHFVRRLDIRFNDQPVLQAELDFALSENPVLRFQLLSPQAGVLQADAEDTEGRRFSTRLSVPAG